MKKTLNSSTSDLKTTLKHTKKEEIATMVGDFNAKVRSGANEDVVAFCQNEQLFKQ